MGPEAQFSITTATIFASRKLPLRGLLAAIAIFVNGAKGVSALQLSRGLDVQYKTAFVLANKLREAMGAEMQDQTLSGTIEIDGAYFGGYVKPKDRIDRRLKRHQSGKRRAVVVTRKRNGRTLPFVFDGEDDSLPTIQERVEPGSLRAAWQNHVWSYDFVMDRTHDGKAFRILTVIDEFTRQCQAIVVDRKLNSDNVLHCLTDLFVQHGPPDHTRSDNGSEFTANAVRAWLGRVGVKTLFIEPGSPWENGYNESFNSKLRDEILNMGIFYTLKEAKVLIERWRHHYNTVRPHSSLGYRPPAPETILPNVDVPAYARQWLRPVHQLKPRQTLT